MTNLVIKCHPVRKKFPPVNLDDYNFTVVEYTSEDGSLFVATGPLLPYSEGANVSLEGEWTINKKDGSKQFSVSSYSFDIPETCETAAAFLKTLDGCTDRVAKKLVDNLGNSVIRQLEQNTAIAKSIVGEKLYDRFRESFRLHRTALSAFLFLRGQNITADIAKKVAMEALTSEHLLEDPFLYSLTSVLPYAAAKKIAKQSGANLFSKNAIQAAMVQVVRETETGGNQEGSIGGNTYIDKAELMDKTAEFLGIAASNPALRSAFASLLIKDRIVLDNNCVYRKAMYEAEKTVAAESKRLLSSPIPCFDNKDAIYSLENQKKMRLAPEQRRAIKTCLSNPFTLLVGGPGCGKTTIEQFIIDLFRKDNPTSHVLLLAPTGKAARRMSESTGESAETIKG